MLFEQPKRLSNVNSLPEKMSLLINFIDFDTFFAWQRVFYFLKALCRDSVSHRLVMDFEAFGIPVAARYSLTIRSPRNARRRAFLIVFTHLISRLKSLKLFLILYVGDEK